jgi:amino acid transporter
MALGWLMVLQNVPWSEVIANAPKVAEGAKKLWNAVAGKPTLPTQPVADAQSAESPGNPALAALESRNAALEAAVSDLHGQMFASSELIKALAEQNTQLVKRIEANRIRVLWLTAATAVLAITTIAAWLR